LKTALPTASFACGASAPFAPAASRTLAPDLAVTARARPVFVVFDLETTGFSPDRHEIIQIAAVRLATNGSIGDTFSTYVRPRAPVPRHITGLTGIRNADVAGAPAAPDALRAFARFVEDAGAAGEGDAEPILMAHNGHRFDLPFIAAACVRHALPLRPVRFIDSIWLARSLWPAESLHNLDAVAARLDIDVTSSSYCRHDARADVHLLATAVRRMVQHLYPVAPAKNLQAKAHNYDFISTE
jgi:DNA polymerase III subunit epsilon